MSVRTVLHDREIEKVATLGGVLDNLRSVAEDGARDVESAAASSSTIKPLASRMRIGNTDTGAWYGSDWGPLVPIEFGTARTPARRLLLGAAEKLGRVEFR